MPRYYFHVTNGRETLENPKGMELSGNAAAREQAVAVRMGDIIEVTYRRHPPAPKDSPFRQRLSWTGSVRRAGNVLASFQSRMD